MSILTYPLGFIGGGKEDFYNGVIENSLKSGATTATDYLDRDKPSSADNVTTWTISWWMKVASIPSPSGQWIFGTMPGTNHTDLWLIGWSSIDRSLEFGSSGRARARVIHRLSPSFSTREFGVFEARAE